MKKILLALFLTFFSLLMACSGKTTHHETAMPDPKSFNAHFGDMDADGDELVSWDEFKAYFPQAKPEIFETIDLNKDSMIDHDEWHEFKEAHGLGHKE